MKALRRSRVKCSLCGGIAEGVELRKWLVFRIQLCQGCISRMLRLFHKGI